MLRRHTNVTAQTINHYAMNQNKSYIDRQHAVIRRLHFIVLTIIAIAIGCIAYLVVNLNRLQKIVDACGGSR
jgi:NhaP-type Na+/H+ or K+/H+ antiporter